MATILFTLSICSRLARDKLIPSSVPKHTFKKMVSDTSLTTWNRLTQPACFSSHHFRWHFSLHVPPVLHSTLRKVLSWTSPARSVLWSRAWGWGQAVLGRIKQSILVPEQTTCLHVHALEIQLFSSVINEGDIKSSPSAFVRLPVLCPIRLW